MLKFLVCTLGIFSVLSQLAEAEVKWTPKFDPPWAGMSIGNSEEFVLTIKNLNSKNVNSNSIRIVSSNPDVVAISDENDFKKLNGGVLNGTFQVVTTGLGEATISVEIVRGKTAEQSPRNMKVIVSRNKMPSTPISIAIRYLHSADISYYFFLFLFLNFGVILNIQDLKSIMVKPTGVFVAFLLTFLMVPVTSFVLEYSFDSDDTEQLFDTLIQAINALSLAYIANCWTVLVRGNFELSVSISAMSAFLSFVFATVVSIVAEVGYQIPSRTDANDQLKWNVLYQFVPLVIGFIFRYFVPKAVPFSSFIVKYILAPFAAFRFTFRYITQDWDVFTYSLITFNSLLAGLGLTLGVDILAVVSGLALKLNFDDCSSIAAEAVTKIVPLVEYLKMNLSNSDCDLFDLLSLTSAIFMPIVLLGHLAIKLIRNKFIVKEQGVERLE